MKKTIILKMILCALVCAKEDSHSISSGYSERGWGLGAVVRIASIPYSTVADRHVGSFIPLIFYDGDYLYFDGVEGGIRFNLDDYSQLALFGRLQFFDIAKKYQNLIQGDNIFWGLQYKIKISEYQFIDTEFLTGNDGNYSFIGRYGWIFATAGWQFKPFIEGQFKKAEHTQRYAGLIPERIPGGFTLAAGFTTRLHLTSNFYLLGRSEVRRLDQNMLNTKYIRDRWKAEIYFGIAFSNNIRKPLKKNLANNRYVRISHGWGTFSDVSEILRFKILPDPFHHQLTSVFFGEPLDDTLFGLPIHIYLNAGIANHWNSRIQNNLLELIFNIKFYYTVPLPVRLRFGVAEGISYITEVTNIEKQKMAEEQYNPSKLLNYLDFSLDLNLGDIFGEIFMPLWIGWSLHHRSGIFETAQHFGRIEGGSNYNTFYLQYHF
jgi:outer membrane protein